jgi:uncharacterized Ntn-hydrolase superfamily protein
MRNPGYSISALGKFILLITLLSPLQAYMQDTFSIVAVDSVTGEIGSAGASCVTSSTTYPHGAAILSDVIPGIGAIHTQAAWNPVNQQNAHDHMIAGESPLQIIDWLVANDVLGNPTTRQYGIVDLRNGHARAAAYTGVNCMNYKSHLTGGFFSVQGNILSGQQILDSMQSKFLNTQGNLAEKLMAALQGAKVVGADTRCAPRNSSSLSAFLRVAQSGNQPDSLWLDLWMAYPASWSGVVPVDPIDSLQTLYNQWKTILNACVRPPKTMPSVAVTRQSEEMVTFTLKGYNPLPGTMLKIFDVTGRIVLKEAVDKKSFSIALPGTLVRCILIYTIENVQDSTILSGKFVL